MSKADRCLKALYQLYELGEPPTTTTIVATWLGIRPSSATEMFHRLVERGYVRYHPYHGVEFTPDGWRRAAEVVRHHRLIELYLYQGLDYPLESVHAEAERLQSAISGELGECIARLLGEPVYAPQGDPIPDRDETAPLLFTVSLTLHPLGCAVVVRRVRDMDSAVLGELVCCRLLPQQRCWLCGCESSRSACLVAVGGEVVQLSGVAVQAVAVEPCGDRDAER
ncbi:MAG: metal-dependent transcriptional regulator [Candidatus Kapabacteria bacterium]|nr:metal-dependent transcriptional regulator [Candidatus Kapabacteria bacterium]MDW8225581.1 metal-dependent transcriptional regulator [Bacteroidota bacterium]